MASGVPLGWNGAGAPDMGKRKRTRRVGDVVVRTSGGSCGVGGSCGRTRRPSGPWLAYVLIGVAGSVLWTRAGVREAIVFSVVTGVLCAAIERLRESPEPGKPTEKGIFLALTLGCFWITAASALLVVTILRTIGVPEIEALGGCYIVAVGSGMCAGLVFVEVSSRRSSIRVR